MVITSDGNKLYVACYSGKVFVYAIGDSVSLESSFEVKIASQSHTVVVKAMAVIQGGGYLVFGTNSGKSLVYDLGEGKVVWEMEYLVTGMRVVGDKRVVLLIGGGLG
mmetsp:Transcript_12532/g.13752  ORF Transcript_12532/g.13752 Transcript_12532/m.13752 type:complete len:107 (+) Transcript_12532:1569-1889(+)